MARIKFIVEVDIVETPTTGFSKSPPSPESVANTIHHHIKDGCGYYPQFNYNTITVRKF